MIRSLALVALLLVTGCGGGGLPASTAEALQGRVEQVVAAADAGDWEAARAGLGQLRADVDAAQRLDRLSADRAAEVLSAADAVEAGLPEPSPPAPVESAPVEPTPVERAPEPEPGKGDEKKDDRKDDGKGEDDD